MKGEINKIVSTKQETESNEMQQNVGQRYLDERPY
jgi:hypothetical protein